MIKADAKTDIKANSRAGTGNKVNTSVVSKDSTSAGAEVSTTTYAKADYKANALRFTSAKMSLYT